MWDVDSTPLLVQTGLCCLFWTAFYSLSLRLLTPTSLSPADRSYWATCVVGTVHAVYTAGEAVRQLSGEDFPLWHDYGTRHADWERVLTISFGFFLFDFILVLRTPSTTGRCEIASTTL